MFPRKALMTMSRWTRRCASIITYKFRTRSKEHRTNTYHRLKHEHMRWSCVPPKKNLQPNLRNETMRNKNSRESQRVFDRLWMFRVQQARVLVKTWCKHNSISSCKWALLKHNVRDPNSEVLIEWLTVMGLIIWRIEQDPQKSTLDFGLCMVRATFRALLNSGTNDHSQSSLNERCSTTLSQPLSEPESILQYDLLTEGSSLFSCNLAEINLVEVPLNDGGCIFFAGCHPDGILTDWTEWITVVWIGKSLVTSWSFHVQQKSNMRCWLSYTGKG